MREIKDEGEGRKGENKGKGEGERKQVEEEMKASVGKKRSGWEGEKGKRRGISEKREDM